jgi:hypothetical protein
MVPSQLNAESFGKYPPDGRKVAAAHIDLLRQLPLGFVPFLLKEMAAYDWKFPAEQREVVQQLTYLESLPAEKRARQMAVFAQLQLSPALENTDWVNDAGRFLEQLSAHLWATHQMDAFRTASEIYMRMFRQASPPAPPPVPRLGIAMIGQGVNENRYRLFRKIRRAGTHFSHIKSGGDAQAILETVQARAAAHPAPFAHWYIDGGVIRLNPPALTCISYDALTPVRAELQNKMRQAYESPNFGAEALRTMLAEMTPGDLSFGGGNPVLDRFQVSLLTEGSGTQIFSTTFVQWAAREALRRAQPLTLFVRFAPRQREQPMNELLTEGQRKPELDPAGSLIDADMGAYYTWVNQQRLPGADRSAFLVLFENHGEAVAVAPGLSRAAEDDRPIELPDLLGKLS